jgi:hypothetical protein
MVACGGGVSQKDAFGWNQLYGVGGYGVLLGELFTGTAGGSVGTTVEGFLGCGAIEAA